MKKGPLAEKQVVDFLTANGFPAAERRVQGGVNDRGDVAGIPGLVIEVKNQQAMALAEWVDEAARESITGHKQWVGPPAGRVDSGGWDVARDLAVVWHKRRGRGQPGDWYVTMDGWTFLEFLKEWAG